MRDCLHGGPGEFAVVQCNKCSCIYLYPRPTPKAIGEYYPDTYGPFSEFEWTPVRRAFMTIAGFPYRVRYGKDTLTMMPFGQRRMLDVGCATGSYLVEMRELGWNVHGVDLSENAVLIARAVIGEARVWAGTIETVDPKLQDFDLITMNHCLEHVPDPLATLAEAHRRLAPEGLLKLALPDVSSAEAKLFGRYWLHWDVPRHLVDFSLESLSTALHGAGFRVESWRPQFAPWNMRASLERWISSQLGCRPRRMSRALNLPVMLLASSAHVCGSRGSIEVVARKVGNSEGKRMDGAPLVSRAREGAVLCL